MNSNVPFWCIPTLKNIILKKLRSSNLCMQLVKLICEKDKDLYRIRLIALAKEITFLFSLVYIEENGKINKPSCHQYKKELFDSFCEDADEMKLRLNTCDIQENSKKAFNIYSAIAKLLSKLLSSVGGDRIHCVEVAFYIHHIIQEGGVTHDIIFGELLPKNIPTPPSNFLPDELII